MTSTYTLLKGVVGSRAYGLATPDSDTDRLGVFAYHTQDILGLTNLNETFTTTNPDVTMHEAKKFVKLAMKCNPTITELLWLSSYEESSVLGRDLIALRSKFLSRAYVRNAYLGYATQQFRKLEMHGRFDSDIPERRTAKHARHLFRLLIQGYGLYRDGGMSVRLADDTVEHVRNFGHDAAADPYVAERKLGEYEALFDTTSSPLPVSYPSMEGPINDWLLDVRREYFGCAGGC